MNIDGVCVAKGELCQQMRKGSPPSGTTERERGAESPGARDVDVRRYRSGHHRHGYPGLTKLAPFWDLVRGSPWSPMPKNSAAGFYLVFKGFLLIISSTDKFRFPGLEQFHMLGDGISSFIFRLGVSTFRIAMVLSLLRRYSDWDQTKPFFEEDEQAITCNDTDFKITMTIMNTLVNHTANVYDALAKDDEGPGNRSLQELSMPERSLFNALGNDFTTKDVTLDAVNLSINPETARRYLGHFCTKYHVAVRDKNGQYHKVKKAL